MAAKTQRARSAKPALTRSKILRRGISLADKQGIEYLSMRKLAESLGVEAMSLYNHVKDKDDLIDGMVSAVIEKFVLPEPKKKWKREARNSAISTHETLMKHRWAAQLLISRVNTGEAMMRYSESWIGCLYQAGFDYPMADHAWNALSIHIYGFTLTLINSPVETKDYAKSAKLYLPRVPADTYPHVRGMMELIISGEHNGINNFEFGLDLILDGLENELNLLAIVERVGVH